MEVTQQRFDHEFRQHLDSMRENKIFCDAVICLDDESSKLPIHRAVMSSCSHYFRSLFTSGLKETTNPEVKITGVSTETMQLIIGYGYTRKVSLTPENVADVFIAADRFNVLGLLDDCVEYLTSLLMPETCIGIIRFAKFYSCPELTQKCFRYILDNFAQIVAESSEFFKLEVQELIDIISDDRLCVLSEKEVVAAVLQWVENDQENRKQHLSELLKHLRLAYIPEKELKEQLSKFPDIKEDSKCTSLLSNAHSLNRLLKKTRKIPIKAFCKDTILVPRIPNEVIFTVGGWSSVGVTASVETYDRNTNQWFEISQCELPTPRAYHGCLSVCKKIYVLGGFDGLRYLNSVISLDPLSMEWEERAPMYMSRCYVSVAEIDGCIYACGGFDGRQRHSSVERYNLERNQWTLVRPMFNHRSDAGAACFKGNLYVVGGFDGHACLNSAEMYNSSADQWTMLAPTNTRRSGVNLVCCSDQIYAIGGYDGANRLNSVETYDPERRNWYPAQAMHLGRSNFSSIVVEEGIYVIGGYDGEKTTAEVECYVPMTKTWHQLRNLNIGRSALSTCALKDFHNARDFTFHGNYFAELDKDDDYGPSGDGHNCLQSML